MIKKMEKDKMEEKEEKEEMSEKQAVDLLKKYSFDNDSFRKVLKHSQAVKRLALKIAKKAVEKGKRIDLYTVTIGSLLHDIGRFSCRPKTSGSIKHGIKGAKIIRDEGLDEKFALICERHIGAGIDKEDIKEQKLDLPKKDYSPKTDEEKIIAYADNLIFGYEERTINDVIKRFREEVSEKAADKVIKLDKYIKNITV